MGVYYLFGSERGRDAPVLHRPVRECRCAASAAHRTKGFLDQGHGGGVADQRVDLDPRRLPGVVIARAGDSAGRYALLNGNQASNPFTPEPLEADCQEFIETIAVLLATLGRSGSGRDPDRHRSAVAWRTLKYRCRESESCSSGKRAAMQPAIRPPKACWCSQARRGRPGLAPSAPPQYRCAARCPCRLTGVITLSGQELVFLKDHLFSSPSAAGCVLIGRRQQRAHQLAQRKGASPSTI